MFHHLFKNAAPGSNAAVWRGLFYKEWLLRKPTRWLPLLGALILTAYWPVGLLFALCSLGRSIGVRA